MVLELILYFSISGLGIYERKKKLNKKVTLHSIKKNELVPEKKKLFGEEGSPTLWQVPPKTTTFFYIAPNSQYCMHTEIYEFMLNS